MPEDWSNTAVLVPCYNEAVTVGKVIDDFHRVLPGATVYVYDNNSSDDTADIARQHGAVVHKAKSKLHIVKTSSAAERSCSG